MCPLTKGPNHGPAPIPEEGQWVKAYQISDISGLTHGVGSVSYTHLDVYKRQSRNSTPPAMGGQFPRRGATAVPYSASTSGLSTISGWVSSRSMKDK